MVFPPHLTSAPTYIHTYAIYSIGTPHFALQSHQHSAANYAHILTQGTLTALSNLHLIVHYGDVRIRDLRG